MVLSLNFDQVKPIFKNKIFCCQKKDPMGESVENSTAVPGRYVFLDLCQRSTFRLTFQLKSKGIHLHNLKNNWAS